MILKVVLHNSISIDGSLSSFEPNMELHYQITGQYHPDMNLIGSHTISSGIELYGGNFPKEDAADFKKPKRRKTLPLWAIVDSKGKLKGLLHICRRFELCQDVIVLVSKNTPQRYLRYLTERHYNYHCVGRKTVDLRQALMLLSKQYHAKTIVADTGRILGNLLLNQGLIDEISLLIHPVIVGNNSYNIFSEIKKNHTLYLVKCKRLEKQYIWLVYKVKKKNIDHL